MKAFDLDKEILRNYEAFSRSFTSIRAEDLGSKVDAYYADGHFWPDALLSINPRFHAGHSADELAAAKVIEPQTAKIFAASGSSIRFHRHQEEAITKASTGQSFVVTTGTGSGKSLCFFVPIVDAVIKARKMGQPPRTQAIIVYPMNALANSQIKEIEKFIAQSGLPDAMKPVVRRYTGQESDAERQEVAANPPDMPGAVGATRWFDG